MKTIRWVVVWLYFGGIATTLWGSPLRPVVKKNQQVIAANALPLVSLTFAIKPSMGKLSTVVFANTETNEEFTADNSSTFLAHPSIFTRDELPARTLSMLVVHLPAGHYRLKELQFETAEGLTESFNLSRPPAYAFEVKPESVNYVGTFAVSGGGQISRNFSAAFTFAIEETSAHDKAWLEGEVPGAVKVASEVSTIGRERPKIVEIPGVPFPVSKRTKLVVSTPLDFNTIPAGYVAVPGTYEAVLETEAGVFFAAPGGLRFGNTAREGGIFLPKETAKPGVAGIYFGKPPEVEMDAEPWHNLFMQEGVLWHLEQPTPPTDECPPTWKALLDDWAAAVERGKWRLVQSSEPVYRYSAPAGWLVSVTLERTGRVSSDEYSKIGVLVVVADGHVQSRMLLYRSLDAGKTPVVMPLKNPKWESAAK